MDILNPVSPLQLEPDERIGVDALLWDRSWGATGRVSAVHAPQHGGQNASTAARAKRFVAGVDAGVMMGEFADVTKAGVSGSGSVAGTGWRTELVWSKPGAGDSYWQGVADLNRRFATGSIWPLNISITVSRYRRERQAWPILCPHGPCMPVVIMPDYWYGRISTRSGSTGW